MWITYTWDNTSRNLGKTTLGLKSSQAEQWKSKSRSQQCKGTQMPWALPWREKADSCFSPCRAGRRVIVHHGQKWEETSQIFNQCQGPRVDCHIEKNSKEPRPQRKLCATSQLFPVVFTQHTARVHQRWVVGEERRARVHQRWSRTGRGSQDSPQIKARKDQGLKQGVFWSQVLN